MKPILSFFLKSYFKASIVLQSLATKKGIVMAPVVAIPIIISIKWSLGIFFMAFMLDFVTGIMASVYENRNRKKISGEIVTSIKLFFETISSEKLRNSAKKLFLYLSTILLVYSIEKTFLIKSFSLKISEAHFTITTIIIALWILIEFYSIVFENFYRMGIDVSEKISNVINKIKSTKKEIQQ